jgi:hypothetical protein
MLEAAYHLIFSPHAAANIPYYSLYLQGSYAFFGGHVVAASLDI